MVYHVMECDGPYPTAEIRESPMLPGGPWMTGRPIQITVPDPLLYTLNPKRRGNLKAMYEKAVPIMREDLIAALQSAGVDNLELYRAIVRDLPDEREREDYRAFNVLGLVACADMQSSQLMGTSTSTLVDVDFHSLVIDEEKARGLLLFRLAESVSAIVVHEKVKKSVEERSIPGMVFYGPGEWSG